jgi:hypothetical protein
VVVRYFAGRPLASLDIFSANSTKLCQRAASLRTEGGGALEAGQKVGCKKMNMRTVWFSILLVFIADRDIHAQTAVKKVRMGIQSTNIGFLPFHVAYHKGFYREQGIDLETIFMSTQAVNAAFVRGDIDYSAAVNGIIQTIVRGASAKILALRRGSSAAVFCKQKRDALGP